LRHPAVRTFATGDSLEHQFGMAAILLDRCRDAAISRGINLEVPYEPWLNVDVMQTLFLDMHEAVGCSWTGALLLSVVFLRVITLPFSVAALKGSRSRALLMPEYQRIMAQRSASTQPSEINDATKKLQAFQQEHGRFVMLRGMWNAIFIQGPIYVTAFIATRGLGNYPDVFVGFSLEAPLWLDSLAMPDPYGILPFMVSAVMLTNVEFFGAVDTELAAATPGLTQQAQSTAVGGADTTKKYSKWMMRGGACAFVPLTWNLPASYFIFMLSNITLATAQTRMLKLPIFERLLDLPPAPEVLQEMGKSSAKRQPIGFPAHVTEASPGPTVRHTTSLKSFPPVRPQVAELPLLEDGKSRERRPLDTKELKIRHRSASRPASELAQRMISMKAPAAAGA